jgi:hypothetical protein
MDQKDVVKLRTGLVSSAMQGNKQLLTASCCALHSFACNSTDVDDCSNDPCASIGNTTNCIDAVAPLTGFSCGCTAGREWKNGQCVGKCRHHLP